MRRLGLILMVLVGLGSKVTAQQLPARCMPEEFGYQHLVMMFGRDSVDVLIQSKKRGGAGPEAPVTVGSGLVATGTGAV